jgi:hypothetical protein
MNSSSIELVFKNESMLGETEIGSLSSRSDSYLTRESYIRNEILRITKKESRISEMYKQLLRAMIDFFSDIVCIDDESKVKEIRCIYANPERAVAKIKQEDSIILPIISISQERSGLDNSRSRYKTLLVHETKYDPVKNRAIRVLSLAPVPVKISYSINVWCKYKSDLDQIEEQIRLKFNPDADISIPNHTLMKATLDDADATPPEFKVGDKEDRLLKTSFSVSISTYLNNPKFIITSNGAIEKLNLEF